MRAKVRSPRKRTLGRREPDPPAAGAASGGALRARAERLPADGEAGFRLHDGHLTGAAPTRRGATRVGAALIAIVFAFACRSPVRHHTSEIAPSPERACGWYADREGDVLYIGVSAFWSERAASGGDPRADLSRGRARRIARFDLRAERFLPPLDVAQGPRSTGVWDVEVVEDGIFFTTFFDAAGLHRISTGETRELADAGNGLAEVMPGPDGGWVVSRYASEVAGAPGSIVVLDRGGRRIEEIQLVARTDALPAPKTVAFDGGRSWLWVTGDWIDPDSGSALGSHPAWVVERGGVGLHMFEEPELQAVRFLGERGFLALVSGDELWLRTLEAGEPFQPPKALEGAVLLDADFPRALDFVQDLQPGADGSLVVIRWSGVVHVVDPTGGVASARLPHGPGTRGAEAPDLYYSAHLLPGAPGKPDRLCATRCAGIQVVCRDWPGS